MDELLNTASMHPRNQITMVMHRIYKRILTTTSGGNLSIKDEKGDIWITPAGVDKGLLKASDIVCVKACGTIVGNHKPSSEFPFHFAIYQARPDIKAIVHAHSPALVAFSIARKIPDFRILPEIRRFCGGIGYTKYVMPGTAELGESIAAEFRTGVSSVIMENHGIVVGGHDISDAYQKFESLEISAQSILYSKMIGKPTYLPDEVIQDYEKSHFPEMPEMQKTSYPSEEREKRGEICKIVSRGCQQGLILGALGTVSARWQKNDFLITPNGISNWDLTLDDIVQVKNGQREKGKFPCASVHLHQAIYEMHPDINAIILTQSPYLTSFAITDVEFNVRTIPETWIYLQNVQRAEFSDQFEREYSIASIISSNTPVVIVKNEGVIVAGKKLLQVFDYLEVAEFSAKSLVLSTILGKMIPIGDDQVEALGKVMERWKNYEWEM